MADSSPVAGSALPLPPGCFSSAPVSNVVPGMAVYQPAASGVGLSQGVTAGLVGRCIALSIRTTPAGEEGIFQYGGLVTLSTADWDAVAGTTGGLARGSFYYVSAATPGHLTSTKPSSEGTEAVRVGVALSAKTLLLGIGRDPAAS